MTTAVVAILKSNVFVGILQLALVGLDAYEICSFEVNLEVCTVVGLAELFKLEVENVEHSSDFGFRVLQNVFKESRSNLVFGEFCYYMCHR